MNVDCFLDTNVLVYAATGTEVDRAKRQKAQALIATANFGISTQVLQEFYVSATRKAHIGMPPRIALEWMEQLDGRPCISVDRRVAPSIPEQCERSEEHTSELQSQSNLVCRLLLEKKHLQQSV